MDVISEALSHVEHTIALLRKRMEEGEDFSDYTAAEELGRISKLREGLLYYQTEY